MDIFRILDLLSVKKWTNTLKDDDYFIVSRKKTATPVYESTAISKLNFINQLLGSVPSSQYKVYTALVSQTGLNDPTVTVLGVNTIGDIVWTRVGDGTFKATLLGSFPALKTFSFPINLIAGNTAAFARLDNNSMITGNIGDDAILNTSIEIRVYN